MDAPRRLQASKERKIHALVGVDVRFGGRHHSVAVRAYCDSDRLLACFAVVQRRRFAMRSPGRAARGMQLRVAMTPSLATLHPMRAPSAALWLVLAALGGAAGCRTTAPRRGPPEAAQSPRPRTAQPPRPEVAQSPPEVVTYVVTARPRFVVTPDHGTYLVLAAGPLKAGSRVAWSVTYLAATDRGVEAAPDAADQLRLAADTLFGAQQMIAEAAGAEVFSVTALFGAPGQAGVSHELTYARDADAWHRSARTVRTELPAIPLLPPKMERDRTGESSAIEVAERFLGHVDRHEYDDAWELSSAVVKATMSRASFERQLGTVPPADDDQRREVFHTFPPGASIPGAELEVVLTRPRALETVLLRMDDDISWHVAALRTIARGEPDRAGTNVAAASAP